ncbi:unnamed protein product [Brugia timori]|uniref:Uncharacterized protein n=1 Tax=Brugia timori TaxID=42155 RepID=A0A0R3RB79_9BILA|nr:unnamed protein product [Brugia timori]
MLPPICHPHLIPYQFHHFPNVLLLQGFSYAFLTIQEMLL